MLSASSLMTLEALSPFALRQSFRSAASEDDLVAASSDVPKLFVDLLDAHVDAPALTSILTLLSDVMTTRLLELVFERYGEPPVAYAWLAFGSAARSELTLASDQDNGLAYADTDDPAVDEYFRVVAMAVNEGLRRCGFDPDAHGVLAQNREWRMSASEWVAVFRRCLEGWDNDRLLRAAVAFDFRQVSGDLRIVPQLTAIIRETPRHARFRGGLADLGSEIRSPLGFRQRLTGPIDIKKSGLLPIQNMARYYAFARGITASTTLERLVGAEEAGADRESVWSLREAFVSMSHLRLRHHANAIRVGRAPDDAIDTAILATSDQSYPARGSARGRRGAATSSAAGRSALSEFVPDVLPYGGAPSTMFLAHRVPIGRCHCRRMRSRRLVNYVSEERGGRCQQMSRP